ncbi:hypothetical protein Olsu_1196 [Olsenella uli DSM 7084]|uniref:Uncharacterized protein n=1 Tax=Olsenella uli (strain ATCC 49627 / DSM 7084 / CCUG 31166 / CIP 109912 / JCM 12494 / LMG 11480 / NCIMB 702895 / VPI D76D-27C) TaxID=633147 RepID=E1QVZ9_OLSUV|nr:hypothetical protein [Olsenella uli]ADK68302.1 hypothetical protein Olsu_1196 [Olsenella uli DSM 7084]KRO12893.1 hypothetical protein IV77_GL000336 [Olsenella uli DSM 7084]
MTEFLTGNEWWWRLARTVTQGALGVVAANLDLLVGTAVVDPAWKALVVALVMAAMGEVRMAKSKLCTYMHITKNHSSGRSGCRVCKLTPHYMAAKCPGSSAPTTSRTRPGRPRPTTAGVNGDVAIGVDEADRAWTSSSAWNDNRTITIQWHGAAEAPASKPQPCRTVGNSW